MESKILAPILTYFFGIVVELGFFPTILKIAKLIPIFKSRNKLLVNNYRPISFPQVFLKFLKK